MGALMKDDKASRKARNCAAAYLWNAWCNRKRPRKAAYDYAVKHLREAMNDHWEYAPPLSLLDAAVDILERRKL